MESLPGASQIVVGLIAKRLELSHDLVPTAGAVALVENPANPIARSETQHVRDAASSLGLELHVVNASSDSDIETAFAAVVQKKIGAVIVSTDPFLFVRANQILTWQPVVQCPLFIPGVISSRLADWRAMRPFSETGIVRWVCTSAELFEARSPLICR